MLIHLQILPIDLDSADSKHVESVYQKKAILMWNLCLQLFHKTKYGYTCGVNSWEKKPIPMHDNTAASKRATWNDMVNQFMRKNNYSKVKFVLLLKKMIWMHIFNQFMRKRNHSNVTAAPEIVGQRNDSNVIFVTTASSKSVQELKRIVASIHEKKKSFQCMICDYSCFQKGNMNWHGESVHEKKQLFKCNICAYTIQVHLKKVIWMHVLNQVMRERNHSNVKLVNTAVPKRVAGSCILNKFTGKRNYPNVIFVTTASSKSVHEEILRINSWEKEAI